jgi:hypothetical protein
LDRSKGGQAVRTSTETLIKAMRIVSDGNDGVVSVAIAEAAQRLEEQQERIKRLEDYVKTLEECGDSLFNSLTRDEALERWKRAKEAKP